MKALVLILAIALGLGFAVHATRITNRNASAMRALASEHHELREKISEEQQRLQTMRRASADLAALRATSAQAKARDDRAPRAPASPATAADAKLTSPVPRFSRTTAIANDPKLMAEALRDYRHQLRLGDLKTVGLSSTQIEALKDLMVEKEQRRMDLMAAIETQGLDQKSDTFKTLNAENERLQRKKEAELLGDLEPAYRDYGRAQEVRWGVTAFALAALDTGEPISSPQFEQVTTILAANSERIQSGPKTGLVKEDTVNWDLARVQLQGVLTPSQIETLRAHYQREVESWKLEQQLWAREALLTAEFKKQRALMK